MATDLQSSNLFASIDMGTNSFKLLIITFEPTTAKFTTLHHLSEPVVLGRDSSSSSPSSPPLISPDSQLRAIQALRKFQIILHSHQIGRTRVVATSALREAGNGSDFVKELRENMGFDFQVDVLSGVEEAKLIYLGVLQFFPFYVGKVLTVDIGGGSTEFVIGNHGDVVYAESLRLGHVTLTQKFGEGDLVGLKDYIRGKIESSGLADKVKDLGFQVSIGSSGTIRAIEKAIWSGYGCNEEENLSFLGEGRKRNWWWFNKEELRSLIDRLCGESQRQRIRRDKFFGRRSEFIMAGAVLLEEILGVLGISEMQVSGYALGEGVVAEMVSEACVGCDLHASVKWKSVVRLAMRFNGKDRMNTGAQCAAFAKDIFEGLRKYNEVDENQYAVGFCLNDKDLEYIEAASMLHNIGLYLGKKGYHKQSFSIIMGCSQLDGYASKEIELIAVLVRHHRKKFPTFDCTSLQGVSGEKLGILCFVLRMSVIFQQHKSLVLRGIKFDHSDEGFIMALAVDPSLLPGSEEFIAKDLETKIRKEAGCMEAVIHQKLLVVLESSAGH